MRRKKYHRCCLFVNVFGFSSVGVKKVVVATALFFFSPQGKYKKSEEGLKEEGEGLLFEGDDVIPIHRKSKPFFASVRCL